MGVTLELNLTNLIAVALAFIGALWTLVKIIAAQQERSLQTRFEGLAESIKGVNLQMQKEQETTQRLERQLMEFKAELPRDYVRREDFIRAVGTIETKIDNMALRVERAVLSGKFGSEA